MNYEAIYNELLQEMCEDIGINVNDADCEMKSIAKSLTETFIEENN